MCDQHAFVYNGVVYEETSEPLPGTSYAGRFYFDAYFCTKCLEQRFVKLQVWETTAASRVLFGARSKVVEPGSKEVAWLSR